MNPPSGPRVLEVRKRLLGKNSELAQRNRLRFHEHGLFTINMLSSPGAGKTALLERLLQDRAEAWRMGVIVGDLATDRDAQRLSKHCSRVVQIDTGNVCHLDADMIEQASETLGLDDLDLVVLENVGNLVCPAGYDLGEDCRIVLISVTEGEDKPLKYPTIFKSADVILITKSDLLGVLEVDLSEIEANLRAVAPQAEVLTLSSRTGQGMAEWYTLLERRMRDGGRST